MRNVLAYSAILLSSLLSACTEPGPTQSETEKKTGAMVVTGAVLDGTGRSIANARVTIKAFPVGCNGALLLTQETQTTADLNGYRAVLDRQALDSKVCLVVFTDPSRHFEADSSSTQRDSVDISADTVRMSITYDWSRIELHTDMFNVSQVSRDDISAKLLLPNEEKTLQGVGSIPPFRIGAGVTYTVVANVNGTDRIATLSKTFTTQADISQGADVIVSSTDPTLRCMGCMGKVSVPIKTKTGQITPDSLFIIWGQNFISQPVIY